MFCWESCERATHLNIVAGLTQQDKSLRKTLKHHSRFPRSQSGWASVGGPGTRLVNEGSDCQPVQSTRPATKSNITPPSALSTLCLVSEQSCSWTVYFIALRKLIIWNSNQDFLFFFFPQTFSQQKYYSHVWLVNASSVSTEWAAQLTHGIFISSALLHLHLQHLVSNNSAIIIIINSTFKDHPIHLKWTVRRAVYTHTFQSFSCPLLTVGHIQKGASVQKRKHSIYTIQYIQALKKRHLYRHHREALCL